MRRRILLVDDEVAVLLTLKAVLEISGFDVDTAASAREGVSRLHTREYHMLITDMRMENDIAGIEVIKAARSATYHPAVALLTAFPVADRSHEAKLAKLASGTAQKASAPKTTRTATAKKAATKKIAAKKPIKKAATAAKASKKPHATVKTSSKKATRRPGAKA